MEPHEFETRIASEELQLELLSEEARWQWLLEAMTEQQEAQAKAMALELKMIAFERWVTSRLPKKHWKKARRPGQTPAQAVHELRLRFATAPIPKD